MNDVVGFKSANTDDFFSDIDTPIPEGLPEPEHVRLLVMPVRQRRRTKSGLWIPDQSSHSQQWAHQLYKVAKVGPMVYSGGNWRNYDGMEKLKPKVGDLVLCNPANPHRVCYLGISFMWITDDQIYGRVQPEFVEGYSFDGIAA